VSTSQINHARHAHLQRVSFHQAADVDASTASDCYLQLWELDFYKTNTRRWLADEETDLGTHVNQRIVSIPGVVVQEGRRFYFRPTSLPAQTTDRMNGKAILSLKSVGQTSAQNYEIALPQFETFFELAATLRTNETDNAYAALQNIPPYPVKNVEASLRHQIEELGGFAVAFVADYRPAALTDINEGEFHKQAEDMLDVLPTFIIEGGDFKMGFYRINDYRDVANLIDQTRNAAKQFLSLPDADPSPRVAMLAFYAHGSRKALKLAYSGPGNVGDWTAPGSLRDTRVQAFVTSILNHVTGNLVVPLFACSAGRGAAPNPDTNFGRVHSCEELGGDSLAWTLFHELSRRGIDSSTVWAHTTGAHTTRNPKLRVFSKYGSADFVNLLVQNPRVPQTTVDNTYMAQFAHSPALFGSNPTLFWTRFHNANLLRSISIRDALYLPWRWNGGADADASTPGFNAAVNQQTDTVYVELRGLVAGAASMPEDVVYEDDTRRFITGLRSGIADTRLSENFRYSEFSGLMSPFRLNVQLMKYVQLLRYRSRRGMDPREIIGHGQGLVLEASPNNNANRTRINQKAQEMLAQGLFTASAMVNNRLYVSVSGLLYDGSWNYIIGNSGGHANPNITRGIPYRMFVGLISPMHVNRVLVERLQSLNDDLRTTFGVQSVQDNGDTFEIGTGIHTAQFLQLAQDYVLLGLLLDARAMTSLTVNISL
jgi:hypothetical protein